MKRRWARRLQGLEIGSRSRNNGYITVYCPEHPFAKPNGYVYEHRLIMEKHLGRYLTSSEVVHHINEDKKDNRLENLKLFNTFKEHLHKVHKRDDRGGKKIIVCKTCKNEFRNYKFNKTRKYCSRKCFISAKKESIVLPRRANGTYGK